MLDYRDLLDPVQISGFCGNKWVGLNPISLDARLQRALGSGANLWFLWQLVGGTESYFAGC